MPRPIRQIAAGVCYHVLNRGNDRRRLFRKPADFAAFFTILVAALERLRRRSAQLVPDAQSLASGASTAHGQGVCRLYAVADDHACSAASWALCIAQRASLSGAIQVLSCGGRRVFPGLVQVCRGQSAAGETGHPCGAVGVVPVYGSGGVACQPKLTEWPVNRPADWIGDGQ